MWYLFKNNNYNLWKNKNNFHYISNFKYNKYEQGPPDLDEIFCKIVCIIQQIKKRINNTGIKFLKKNNNYISLMILIIFLIWIGSGFYTIKEAERGVVLRFGKFHHLVQPGLNWKPIFIDTIIAVNIESVRELAASGLMLTSDENVVRVEMNVQYRVVNPKKYLFNVTNADNSLRQATDSALRGVIGKYTMDCILTEGRTIIRSDTQKVLEDIIFPYNMGITLLDVNFQAARPPEEVKAAFDDAIAARENEQQYIREAEAYANEMQPKANGKAQRILEEGRAYKARTVLEAQGEIQRFLKIFSEYQLAPKITKQRLYIETMERIFKKTHKILIDQKNNNIIMLPIDKILHNTSNNMILKKDEKEILSPSIINKNHNQALLENKRSIHANRDNTTREVRKGN